MKISNMHGTSSEVIYAKKEDVIKVIIERMKETVEAEERFRE
jgi:hypothetical protein